MVIVLVLMKLACSHVYNNDDSIVFQLCDSCLADDIDNDGTGCDNMAIILALLKPLDKLFHK